jgi:hypothetical protein
LPAAVFPVGVDRPDFRNLVGQRGASATVGFATLVFGEVEADVLNKGKHWTAAEDEVLKQEILMGASVREI